MKTNWIRIAMAATCVALIGACKGTEPTQHSDGHGGTHAMTQRESAPKPVNKTCPIMGGEVDPTGELASYGEFTIGFCCDGCKPKWEALDDDKKAAFLAETSRK